MSEFASEHRTYFDSPAGIELRKQLKAQKKHLHDKAESADSMELSYGFTQRAKGLQEAIDIINSMTAKGKPM